MENKENTVETVQDKEKEMKTDEIEKTVEKKYDVSFGLDDTIGALKVHLADMINVPNTMQKVMIRRDLKDVVRYPLAREGVYAPGGPAFLAHTKQKVSYIVGITALRLALFMGYE